jgi:hypothetical protein
MELIGREAELEDGLWYTLPHDKNWKDAEAAGIEQDMLALRKGDIVLALFPGLEKAGQVFAIGLKLCATMKRALSISKRKRSALTHHSPINRVAVDHPGGIHAPGQGGFSCAPILHSHLASRECYSALQGSSGPLPPP